MHEMHIAHTFPTSRGVQGFPVSNDVGKLFWAQQEAAYLSALDGNVPNFGLGTSGTSSYPGPRGLMNGELLQVVLNLASKTEL